MIVFLFSLGNLAFNLPGNEAAFLMLVFRHKQGEFFAISTSLMFYTITVAIAQIANNDKVGIFTANLIEDGDIEMSIEGGPSATLRAKDGRIVTLKCKPDNPRAVMSFASMKLARDLFDCNVNALECIGSGAISMKGLISMIDNLNRLLDRVAVYLA